MQATPTINRRGRNLSLCLMGIGLVAGALAAFFVHHAGRGWFATLFAGIYCGIGGAGSAFLFLRAALRIIWLFRYVRRTKNEK